MHNNDIGPIVIDMPNATVTEDGSITIMEFKNSDGSSQVLRFPPDKMMQYLSNVFELFLNQKIRKESGQGYSVVRPLQVSTTMAQEDIKGKSAILQFRMKNGIPAAFAVSPEEAEELHRQLGKAVKKLRKRSSFTHH